MATPENNTVKLNSNVLIAVTDILARAILAQRDTAHAQTDLQHAREGAYSLYVSAAIKAAGKVEYLAQASDVLFNEIRKTGALGGKSLHVKEGKEGGFIIPSAISAAKSIMTSAMAGGVALKDEKGKARSFGSIRKDVFEINRVANQKKAEAEEKVRLESLEGADKLRETEGKRIVAELASIVGKEGNEADLQDLLNRVNAAMRDYGIEQDLSEQGDDVGKMVAAASETPARRVHSKKRTAARAAA